MVMVMIVVVPGILDEVIMMMMDWIRFQMMVYYWFNMLMIVIDRIRRVVMMVQHTYWVMVTVVDCHRMVMMVTRLTMVNTRWIPMFDMLVYLVMWYRRLLVSIIANVFGISASVEMV